MPSEGIMQMSRAMAPQSAISQNTGVNDMMQQESVRAPQPEQPMMMARGGYVRRMQDGGAMLPPRIEDQEYPMSREEYMQASRERLYQDALEEALAMMESSPGGAGRNAIRRLMEQIAPDAYAASLNAPGRNIEDSEGGLGNLAILAALSSRRPGVDLTKYASGGYVRSMQDGGFTGNQQQGYLIFLQSMGLADSPEAQQMYMQMMARQRERGVSPKTFMPDMDRAPESMSLPDVSTDVGAFLPGAGAAPSMMGMPPSMMEPSVGTIDFDASVAAVPAAPRAAPAMVTEPARSAAPR
jgi:hypothetical protein